MKIITLRHKNAMLLRRKVVVLRKMMILKIVKRMRVLMMETLMSQRNLIKHGLIFLCPLMKVKLRKSSLLGYMKQKEAKDFA